jgi:YidC/Oxa1 family membrane protein insertase
MNENRNLLAAVILSMVIMLGYQYFFVAPRQAAVNQAQQAAATTNNGASNEGQGAMQAAPSASQTKADLANLPPVGEVVVSNGRVAGRINLRGARFDRLNLKDYQQHAGDNSDPVQLFNDAATADGFVMTLGWQAAKGQGDIKLPDATTAWQGGSPHPDPRNIPSPCVGTMARACCLNSVSAWTNILCSALSSRLPIRPRKPLASSHWL